MYDPIKRTQTLKKHAFSGDSRAYYRFRPAKWYGGIVTGDVFEIITAFLPWPSKAVDIANFSFALTNNHKKALEIGCK